MEYKHRNMSFLFLNTLKHQKLNYKKTKTNLRGIKNFNLPKSGPRRSTVLLGHRPHKLLNDGLCSRAFVTWDFVPVTTQE